MTGPTFRIVAYDSIDSTNDEARRLAAAGTGAGTVVVAAEQTAGRGRRRREWESRRGNLFASFLLDGGPEPARRAELAFVAAVALRDALAALAPAATFSCKWPNDVLCDGRKISGMLLEGEGTLVILGVGVNVAHAPADALVAATSLADAGVVLTPTAVLKRFCAELESWLARWRVEGFAPVRGAWRERAVGIGGAVTVRLADGVEWQGRFVDLDEEGALLLDSPGAGRRRVVAGDVFFA